MKKLILGLALTAGTFAFAQQTGNTSSNPVTFGVKGGMNVSSLSKDSGLDDQKSKIGFNAGVFANIPLAASFSVQPEVQYSQYGNKSDYTFAGTKYSASTKLDYITVPVMFQYNLIPDLYVEAGPEFGFMVSAKNKFKNESNGQSNTTDNYKDNLNTFNFGIGLGAGYYFTPNLGLTARYVAGLTDIAKNRPSGSDAVRNNLFQVGLAYKFK
ncbi:MULTISPECIES: porin family protein [Chryseobacterium]|uniref:PorT family protein n=1 Tax=Chryseobacterium candidae TaxID=1978493 RepID=A0ABY2R5Y1_9FLAO|nr:MULTISPECIES: porin family protein [Chryseobacterium]PXW17926.1 outer membrane protein with beta-barrel domain [Chryseobacterium sp. CBTAP 102]THV58603.1 PorT family protein [Chryseobacterium candidae]SIQ09632.1 Outer membrane protein beta-barrel domain-containing protein [Chryseobacterium sp. RU33C]